LVAGIGQLVIDLQPPGGKDLIVGLFGTNDKLALEIFIVVVALAIGAGPGILARSEMGMASIGFALFGVVGFLTTLRGPLSSRANSAAVAGISLAVGICVLGWLSGRKRATAPYRGAALPPERAAPAWSRRSFLIR